MAVLLTGCQDDAVKARQNIAKAADNFEINRRIVFYNTWMGEYMLTIEGFCSMSIKSEKLLVTCKDGDSDFKTHHLGLSNNISYVSQQLQGADVSVYHSRIIFKPQSIIPDFELRVDGEELMKDRY